MRDRYVTCHLDSKGRLVLVVDGMSVPLKSADYLVSRILLGNDGETGSGIFGTGDQLFGEGLVTFQFGSEHRTIYFDAPLDDKTPGGVLRELEKRIKQVHSSFAKNRPIQRLGCLWLRV